MTAASNDFNASSLTFQGDPDQNGGGETEARQIQNCLIAADETFFLQHLLPSCDRRAREPNPLGEFDLAGAGIDRKFGENRRIYVIKLHWFCFLRD